MATFRQGELRFSNEDSLMGLPVQTGYLWYQESMQENRLKSGYSFVEGQWLDVGPLKNSYYWSVRAKHFKEKDTHIVSQTAPSCIELLPCEDIMKDHDIEPALLEKLESYWNRSKLKIVS